MAKVNIDNTGNSIINCFGMNNVDMNRLDGGLNHVQGVRNQQLIRPVKAQGDYTYNHAPCITVYNNMLLVSYISGERHEHVPPCHVMMTFSNNGYVWEEPVELFSELMADSQPYQGAMKELLPKKAMLIPHHRMSFYTAKNQVLLACCFYGFSPDNHMAPNNGYGLGRLVREIRLTESSSGVILGDLYLLKGNRYGGFDRDNIVLYSAEDGSRIAMKMYSESDNKAFVDACEELLADKLVTQQWYEEEQLDPEYVIRGKAPSIYTDKNGTAVAICKKGLSYCLTKGTDGYIIASETPETLVTNTAKVWGQRLFDGNYALFYNPTSDGAHRWPLAMVTGPDGHNFYDMKAVLPEVYPYRYTGNIKNLGAQYMRGIQECNLMNNPIKKDSILLNSDWLVYSTNKEDIWVSQLTSDTSFSVTYPKFSSFERTLNGFYIKEWDACARVWLDIFVDNTAWSGMNYVNIKRLSDANMQSTDNPIYLAIYDKADCLLKEYLCYHDRLSIDLSLFAAERISRITIKSKAFLNNNTLLDDGRYGQLKDLPLADEVSETEANTVEFLVSFL